MRGNHLSHPMEKKAKSRGIPRAMILIIANLLPIDLILDGAFNINSTSVDAWIAQLSSLRGHSVENVNVGLDRLR